MKLRLMLGVVAALMVGLLQAMAPAQASAGTIASCTSPSVPSWWASTLQSAANDPNDSVPSSWGTSVNIARIVCRESDFVTSARNGQYYGLGQMSQAAVEATGISWSSYSKGSSAYSKAWYQVIAALRYCKSRYGDTTSAWNHEVNSGWW